MHNFGPNSRVLGQRGAGQRSTAFNTSTRGAPRAKFVRLDSPESDDEHLFVDCGNELLRRNMNGEHEAWAASVSL